MTMTKKVILRGCAFVLIFALVLLFLCDLFETEKTKPYSRRLCTYRECAEDTIDAVYIGTSGVDRYWIGAKAYEDYGMTVFPVSTDAMPVFLFTKALDEAFTYQNPQMVIIDARGFGQVNTEENMDTRSRRFLDSLKFLSKNWFSSVRKTLDAYEYLYPDAIDDHGLSFYLPFVKYHPKWKEDDFGIKENIGMWADPYSGFYMSKGQSIKQTEQTFVEYDPTYKEALDPLAEKSLYEVIDYVKQKDVEVLFVDTPQFMSVSERGKAMTVYSILEEAGINYVSYSNELDMFGLDPKTDFYNSGHVNYYGAEKFTKVFAKYLDENYDLPDRRNDPVVQEQWGESYDNIVAKIAEYEAEKMLEEVKIQEDGE